MKKFSPQANIVEGIVTDLVAAGIINHEFQKNDPIHGMKEVQGGPEWCMHSHTAFSLTLPLF